MLCLSLAHYFAGSLDCSLVLYSADVVLYSADVDKLDYVDQRCVRATEVDKYNWITIMDINMDMFFGYLSG
jgi:hypothetical protein